MTKVCDNRVVGVLISDEVGRQLMFRRATLPVGIAPVAGHIDDHGSSEQAARNEVAEEVGLTVTTLTLVASVWRNNVCGHPQGPAGPGHHWDIYQAVVDGSVDADPREAHDPRWYTAAELQDLSNRTVAYAHGAFTADQRAAAPGLEPVWVQFLADFGLITVHPANLELVDQIACRPPRAT